MIRKFVPCLALIIILYGLCTDTLFAWSGGPPAYRTGAPGDDGTCHDTGCHNSFELNSGSAKFSVTADDTYIPGKFIKIEISFTESAGTFHGFEMTALDDRNNRIGKFKKIGKTTRVISPNDESRGLRKEDKGKYIEHTAAGNKKKRWKVKWKAPSDATGPITFYAAGNEADGNGNPSGDFIYTAIAEINAVSSVNTSGLNRNGCCLDKN
jgi:hypothetical protein